MIETIEIPIDVVAAGKSDEYTEMIRRGNKPRMAEMLCLQQANAAGTTSEFLKTVPRIRDVYGDGQEAQKTVKSLRKAGVTADLNTRYSPGAARKMADPNAVFDDSRGRCYAKKTLNRPE